MARYLQVNITGPIELKSLNSLSHYSTLFHAAPLIFKTMTSMEKQQ